MVVYLIRHGETDAAGTGLYGRAPGISLGQSGKIQAAHIAEHLGKEPIAAIYSSPLERTMETALPLATAQRLRVQASPAFIEVDQGDWTGLSWQTLHTDPIWRNYNTYRSGTGCPHGEMAIEVQARVVREFDRLLLAHGQDHIAIFSHADVIRAAVCHYAGIALDLALRVEISPGSISSLELRHDGARILGLNRTLP